MRHNDQATKWRNNALQRANQQAIELLEQMLRIRHQCGHALSGIARRGAQIQREQAR